MVTLGVAFFAQSLLSKPPGPRLTYGFQRAEVLAAQVNSLMLGAIAIIVGIAAIRRLSSPPEVSGALVAATAAVGVAINAGSSLVLWRSGSLNLNLRAALLNMGADALLSLITLIAGIAIQIANAYWIDPAASLAIAALMMVAAAQILWEVSHVLLEGAPRHLKVEEVAGFLARQPGVEAVHHLHIWNLSSENTALSGHVVFDRDMTLHEAQLVGAKLRQLLEQEFGISHTTLELECHPCDQDEVLAL